MKTNQIIDSRGVIIKEEMVKSLQSEVLENSLVLENTDPFPGYFGENLPDVKKPRSLFIILDRKYEDLFLARLLKKISNSSQHKCIGSFGDLTLKEKVCHCIRIKNLDCFPSVINIQRAIADSGTGLMKYQQIDELALIRIKKNFLMQALDEEIYKDMFESERYYISIPAALDWEDFKKITRLVKNNIVNNLFDAALGYVWRIDGLMDMVRIYDKKNDPERIKTIRDKYLSEIKRLYSKSS